MNATAQKPPWLKVKLPSGEAYAEVHRLIKSKGLHTVCGSARCPNLGECWGNRTATFMILGNNCTRNCSFCAVLSDKPEPLDPGEPRRVAESVQALSLKYAVITSVTRDDLPDGGAAYFAATIHTIRELSPTCRVEVLIPDFQGDPEALQTVIDAAPDVLNHNLETVPSLYPTIRPQADYRQSLELLESGAASALRTKTGLMLGLGETDDEIESVLRDILNVNCRLLTLGQYLQPTKSHHPVIRYLHPDEFSRWADVGHDMGFDHIEAGPLVRSSYMAHEQVESLL
jgi:lipoic acid synthetase